ncbi:hypothetical protein [Caballeronia sp. Lep1P3]|uniref:hypothetical protein n=1 Tax=Caballeronia sp. Lep1P3 TaxID=2878150 RepID=UPI001FD5E306|nr:hypothetical protein [Caballeronia sp. Lep1P3]
MIKIVVTGAENNATFRYVRNEKNRLSPKTHTAAERPPINGLSDPSADFFDDMHAQEKFRAPFREPTIVRRASARLASIRITKARIAVPFFASA